MARTYLSTLSPRRRWGIASAAAGLVLIVTVGLGEPWGYSTIGGLPADRGFRSVSLLARTPQVFHWTTGSAALGGSSPWIAAFVLDLSWPLLILIGTRALAGGLALKRARGSLIVGVWSLTTLTGAFAGLIAGLVDHAAGHGWLRVAFTTVGSTTTTGDVLTLQASTMALIGVVIGWLPGVAAALAYTVNRKVPDSETDSPQSGEEKTLTEEGTTLSLENLEELRRVRQESGRLPDARGSDFFSV